MRFRWTPPHLVIALLLSSVVIRRVEQVRARYYGVDGNWSIQNTEALDVEVRSGGTLRIIFMDDTSDYALAFFDLNSNSPSANASDSFILAIVVMPPSNPNLWQVVWSANRDRPVGRNATLGFALDGNLVLWDSYGVQLWSTDCMAGIHIVGVDMQTTGDFIVYDTTHTLVWESFDHPTDTILPGQVLHVGASLAKNSSGTDATVDGYRFVVEDGGLALYALTNASQAPYWVSSLNLVQSLQAVLSICQHPAMVLLESNQGLLVKYDLALTWPSVSNTSLCSTTYLESNLALPNKGQSNVPYQFVRLDADGNLRLYVYTQTNSSAWQVLASVLNSQCDLPGACGKYGLCLGGRCNCTDSSKVSGDMDFMYRDDEVGNAGAESESVSSSVSQAPVSSCKPPGVVVSTLQSPQTNCSTPPGYRQQVYIEPSVDYFSNQYLAPDYHTSTVYQCGLRCLNFCSCAASFYHNDSGACYLVTAVHSLQRVVQPGYSALIKVSAPVVPTPPPPTDGQEEVGGRKRSSESISIGVSVGLVSAALLLAVVLWTLYTLLGKKKGTVQIQKLHEDEAAGEDEQFADSSVPGLPPRLTLKDLSIATNGFQTRIGHSSSGGFGPVYEGCLADGTKVAVKKLDSARQLGKKEFLAELAVIASIQHVNIVRLRGFCIDGIHQFLVYDYVAKGSLDKWLFAPKEGAEEFKTDGFVLDWNTRIKIALGAARGLGYLHEDCATKIIHSDISPQNLLLDDQFLPKISKTSVSKLLTMDRDDSEVSGELTARRGTPGYLAPELLMRYQVTEKIDIYSYGVVLIELLTGRKSIDLFMDFDSDYFPSWGMNMARDGRLRAALDKRLGDLVPEVQCQRVIQIAYWCVHRDSKRRPTMKVIVQMLEGLTVVPDMPEPEIADLSSFKLLAKNSFNERRKKELQQQQAEKFSPTARPLPTTSGS